jgi:hypothetical protein
MSQQETIVVDPRPWIPVTTLNAPYLSRSAAIYAAVLDALPLFDSPRYQPRDGLTFCNIFVWDATRLLGCEVPHWVGDDGTPCAMGHGREQTANDMSMWLAAHGAKHGWLETTAADARARANQGVPAIVSWWNPSGAGHIAMVRPGEIHPEKGPCIAQAGRRNFRDGHVLDGFGHRNVEYFVHLLTNK